MRVYLVVIDESEEAVKALRFAARRASASGGAVRIVALVQPQKFNAFGSVQATIEAEARDRAEALANGAAASLMAEGSRPPGVTVLVGEAQSAIGDYLARNEDIAALVLAAGTGPTPGPLVAHFSTHAGALPCPLYIVPARLDDAAIDRLA